MGGLDWDKNFWNGVPPISAHLGMLRAGAKAEFIGRTGAMEVSHAFQPFQPFQPTSIPRV